MLSASSLLNWSYQNSKTCTVLVGENSEIPSSKATTSETNLSTSSKPRPSSGGNENKLIYSRKRRQVDNTPHASVFLNITNSSASGHVLNNITHANYSDHKTTVLAPLHDLNVGTSDSSIITTPQELDYSTSTTFSDPIEISEELTTEAEIEYEDDAKNETEELEEMQRDYPVYSYGQEEVQIIKLNEEPLSAKSMYNQSSSSFVVNENNNPSLEMHESNQNNTPNVTVVQIAPPLSATNFNPSKRVLVNVTIATDPDSSNPYSTQSVYVLSVSIPTNGDPNQVSLNPDPQPPPENLVARPAKEGAGVVDQTTDLIPKEIPHHFWGGQCQCSCPCLDDANNVAANDTDDYFVDEDGDLLLGNNATTETSEAPTSTTDATTEVDFGRTESSCPDISSTKLPPAPTILILEGRAVYVFRKRRLAAY